MDLEAGRNLFRGTLILISAALSYWVNLKVGLALVIFIGVMILQSAITDWCPVDLILKSMGLKKRLENKR